VNNVNTYRGYMSQAQKLEASNPQEAIQQLTLAKNLNPNGPGNPAGRIAELQQAMQKKTAPPPPAPTKQPVNSGADLTKKVNKLLSDARQAEKEGKQQDALTDYAEVLKLQPGNGEAQSSTDRIQQAIKSDPAAAKSELKAAIRYFYNSQFDDARRALMSYLESPQTARTRGCGFLSGSRAGGAVDYADTTRAVAGTIKGCAACIPAGAEGELQPGAGVCVADPAEDLGFNGAIERFDCKSHLRCVADLYIPKMHNRNCDHKFQARGHDVSGPIASPKC
jgi:hypothetical protein